MEETWLRNEWIFDEGEKRWVQSRSRLCVINRLETTSGISEMIRIWDDKQWLRPSHDLIIGTPRDHNQYLVVFSKEVR